MSAGPTKAELEAAVTAAQSAFDAATKAKTDAQEGFKTRDVAIKAIKDESEKKAARAQLTKDRGALTSAVTNAEKLLNAAKIALVERGLFSSAECSSVKKNDSVNSTSIFIEINHFHPVFI